jgi:hypothetical protein
VTITNGNGGQANTQVEAETSEIDQDTEHLEGEITGDADDDQDDDVQPGGRRVLREAGYRRRAQAAEAERDQLRTQLDTLHRQAVADIAKGAGLIVTDVAESDLVSEVVGLLEKAGHDLASFITDDGTVDRAGVIDATTTTMRRYNIRPGKPPGKPPRPNLQQGAYGLSGKAGGVAGVIQDALGR